MNPLLPPRFLLFPLLASVCLADVKLPAIFGDHMVLQQDQKIPVWGWASPGERITVTLGGRTGRIIADADGKWRIDFPAVTAASAPTTLIVTGKNTVTFTDVLIGEVWLAAGQSNMEYGIGGDVRSGETIPKAGDPQLRLFTVPSNATGKELDDLGSNGRTEPKDLAQGKWQACTPEMLRLDGAWNGFSAVGYYFGRNLRDLTRRPVGMIVSTRGGTRIEPWISLAGLRQPPAFSETIKDYENKSARPDGGGSLGPGIPSMPASIFNATIAPLVPFAIKGMLWYQGESNAPQPGEYATLLPRLITDWRGKWNQGDFPFLFVQLPGFAKPQENWPLFREAQAKALALPNTGMACTIDLGNPGDIHPNDKIDVGTRLALIACHLAYGDKTVVSSGPVYQSAKNDGGGRVRLLFQSVGGGLVISAPPPNSPISKSYKPTSEVKGFTLAGSDRKWFPAKAGIEGSSVIVGSDQVPHPIAVRYAWDNTPETNLYNKEGLPALPFRTDSWPHTADPQPNTIWQAVEWNKECVDRVASFKGKPCDVIFIGDSITQNFIESPKNGWNLVGRAVWDKYYSQRRALDFGVGGDSIQNALWRLDTMDVKGLRPKVAVIMLGMNNSNDTATDIAGGVQAGMDKARLLFPGVKLVSMSVTANGRMPEKTPRINELLQQLARQQSAAYVDIYSKMTPTGPNSWKGVGGDQVHLTPEGYELWAAELEPILKKLIVN